MKELFEEMETNLTGKDAESGMLLQSQLKEAWAHAVYFLQQLTYLEHLD